MHHHSKSRCTRRALAGSALLCVLAASAAPANPADPPSPSDTALYFFDPVVVTAVRPAAALTVIARPKDPRQPVPAGDGGDYLRGIPGFAAIRNGGTNGDPVLRGMFGSRLHVLTDGSCMLGACPGRMDAPSAYIAPENFDVLTVIKGPQSVAWGPGASAGTVNFEHHTPVFSSAGARVEPAVLGGSWGRNDQRVDLTAGTRRGYARIGGSRAESGDYADGDGEAVPSRYRKWSADAALGWTPGAGTRLELDGGIGDGLSRYAGRGMDGVQFLRRSAGARFTRSGMRGPWSALEAQISYHDVDHVMDNYSLRTPDPMSAMPMPMASQVERRTVNGRLTSSFGWPDRVQLLAGVDAQANEHRGRSASGIDRYSSAAWKDDASMRDLGAFLEANWSITSRSHVAGGVRVDLASAKDERQTTAGMMPMPNPTAGERREETLPSGFVRYVRDLAARGQLYVGVGDTARFPDYWELFSPDAAPPGATNAFAGIDPERTTQLDLGAQLERGRARSWVSAYAGEIRDYIVFEYATGGMMGPISTARNVDARIAGGEAGAAFALSRRWGCDASLAYAWGETRGDGSPLPQMPPFESRFGVSYDDRTAWSVGLLARVVAAQERVALDQGNVVGRDLGASPGFAVLSLNGARRLTGGLRLAAGVDNLLDRTYSEHLNLAGDSAFGYPGDPVRVHEPGRMFWARLDLRPGRP